MVTYIGAWSMTNSGEASKEKFLEKYMGPVREADGLGEQAKSQGSTASFDSLQDEDSEDG